MGKNLKNKLFHIKSRIARTITSILPVDSKRVGKCTNCGACCTLPEKCMFLEYTKEGKAKCKIYKIRPLNCRKYPRTSKECITATKCGYKFNKN